MQNTTTEYKRLINQSGRTFKVIIICTFESGEQITLTDTDIMQNSLEISSATSSNKSFDIGSAIISELDFEIDNTSGIYKNVSFDNAIFDVRIGLVTNQSYTGNITIEWLKKGIYIAEEITINEKYISIVAYDYMAKLDKNFSDITITYPIAVSNLLSKVCEYCGVAYGSLDFPNNDYIIKSSEYISDNTSCRDIVSYIAQIACSFAYIDMSGYLRLGWYTDTDIAINEKQKINESIILTGVVITNASTEDTYILGTTDYALIIDDNPLIQSNKLIQSTVWNERLIGTIITPFTSKILSDPSLETGDIVTISDLQGNKYKSMITSVKYALDNKMTISCDAETVNEKKRTSCSQSAKVIAKTKKETQKQISAYDIRAKQFSELTANAMGYYQTEEIQDNGTTICYQHDKPLLSESKIIWKKSVDTISVSNDGGKTWIGLDKDGNAVLRVLATEGIVADWINAGTLQGIKIIADNGEIGGWNINNIKMYAGDSDSGVAVVQKPTLNTTWVFGAGGSSHENYSDCPFKVSKSGKMYATNAEINGKIVAESGKIGNWNINGGLQYDDNTYIKPERIKFGEIMDISSSEAKFSGQVKYPITAETGESAYNDAGVTYNAEQKGCTFECGKDGNIKFRDNLIIQAEYYQSGEYGNRYAGKIDINANKIIINAKNDYTSSVSTGVEINGTLTIDNKLLVFNSDGTVTWQSIPTSEV